MSQETEGKEELAELRRDLTDLRTRVESAFLRDEQGTPDYSGHKSTHKAVALKEEELKRTKATIIKNITTWAVIGVLTVIGSSLAQVYLGTITILPK